MLPNPAIAVNPDTNTALPVLRDKIPGVLSSAKRLSTWIPLVTPMPMTNGTVIIFARLKAIPVAPMMPASHNVPTATGNNAKKTAGKLRKCKSTNIAMAIKEYHAA